MIIGIIGTGFGKTIGQTFKAVDPSCSILVSGNNRQNTETVANEIGAQVVDSWEDLVKNPDLDLIVIATPNYLHKQMFEAAIKSQKNIMIEKPAASFASDIQYMIDIAKDYPKLIVVNHEARFSPVTGYIKDMIKTGKLGDILTVRIGAYLNLYTDDNYTGSWYGSKELGGGQLLAIGSHQVDLARFLLDMPNMTKGAIFTATYENDRFAEKVDAESQFSGNLVTESGVLIELFNDSYCFGAKDFIVEVIGSKGIIKYSDVEGLRISQSNDQPLELIAVADPLPEINIGKSILSKSVKYFVKDLIEAIENNSSNDKFCDLQTAADNLTILEKYKV